MQGSVGNFGGDTGRSMKSDNKIGVSESMPKSFINVNSEIAIDAEQQGNPDNIDDMDSDQSEFFEIKL